MKPPVTRHLLLMSAFLLSAAFSTDGRAEEPPDGSGDILYRAIALSGLGTSLAIRDGEGANQFWKGGLTTAVLTQGLKPAIDEKRPNGRGNMSFPSGHTSASFFGASFIQRRYGWKYATPAYLAAGYVGWCRVRDDAHYVHDVLAGAAIGVMSAYVFTTPFTKDIKVAPFVADRTVGIAMRPEF